MNDRFVYIRFYEELNNFLDSEKRKREIRTVFPEGATVKVIIEELGVPHTEVDLVLVNGTSVDFSYRLASSDRISVYPVFESLDISVISKVRQSPLRITRFVLDVHLGKLARCLRMLGFDSSYSNTASDGEIASTAVEEARIILTRDRGLLKRKLVTHGYLVRAKHTEDQLREVLDRFDLGRNISPFSICIDCNVPLLRVPKEAIESLIPPKVFGKYDLFSRCASCGKVYWRGTHWEDMAKKISILMKTKPISI